MHRFDAMIYRSTPHCEEILSPRIRQGAKQDLIHNAKDRDIYSNPKTQREYRDSGKHRVSSQNSNRIFQIMKDFIERTEAPRFMAHLCHPSAISELTKGVCTCLLRIHPILYKFVNPLLKMSFQLIIEILVKVICPKILEDAFHDSASLIIRLRPSIMRPIDFIS